MIFARLKKQLKADYAPELDLDRMEKRKKSYMALMANRDTADLAEYFAEAVEYQTCLAEFWEGMYLLANPSTEERIKRRLND